jgi:hypothetical protein
MVELLHARPLQPQGAHEQAPTFTETPHSRSSGGPE